MLAAKVKASLRIRAVSPEPPLLAYTSSESRGTVRQKARSLALLDGWACAVKICHDGVLDAPQLMFGLLSHPIFWQYLVVYNCRYKHHCVVCHTFKHWLNKESDFITSLHFGAKIVFQKFNFSLNLVI